MNKDACGANLGRLRRPCAVLERFGELVTVAAAGSEGPRVHGILAQPCPGHHGRSPPASAMARSGVLHGADFAPNICTEKALQNQAVDLCAAVLISAPRAQINDVVP